MAIQRRYKLSLQVKLDQLWHQGYTILERWELLAWFEKERLTNVVWREIQELWMESYELEENERPLDVIKCDQTSSPQTFIIIQTERTVEISELSS